MRRTLLLTLSAISLLACGGDPVAIPEPRQEVVSFNGLEQELTVTRNLEWDDSGEMMALRSRIINRSDKPVTVRLAHCWLFLGDNIITKATFTSMVMPSCAGPEPGSDGTTTLQPGEASKSLSFVGAIEFPGTYTFKVKHLVDPEFWGEIKITAR
ncbi:MAG TPA: hypothetical protein VFQ45_13365 [Longimicrobium sp.]|nr:hypothetical protein [Longimicrobium sp.]